MSLPTFSHATAGTVAFTRAYIFPLQMRTQPRQRVGRSDGGQVYVATLGPADIEWQLEFRLMPVADRNAALAFLGHAAINYAETAFTFTDVDGVATSVHCLDFEDTLEADDAYLLRFTLLKDVP